MTDDAREESGFWRRVRQVAREVAQEEFLEHEYDTTSKPRARPRRPRKDVGEHYLWDPAEFDTHLREVVGEGNVTVQRVLDRLKIKSRTTLRRYLQPYEFSSAETPSQIIRRLEREWFPDRSLL